MHLRVSPFEGMSKQASIFAELKQKKILKNAREKRSQSRMHLE